MDWNWKLSTNPRAYTNNQDVVQKRKDSGYRQSKQQEPSQGKHNTSSKKRPRYFAAKDHLGSSHTANQPGEEEEEQQQRGIVGWLEEPLG